MISLVVSIGLCFSVIFSAIGVWSLLMRRAEESRLTTIVHKALSCDERDVYLNGLSEARIRRLNMRVLIRGNRQVICCRNCDVRFIKMARRALCNCDVADANYSIRNCTCPIDVEILSPIPGAKKSRILTQGGFAVGLGAKMNNATSHHPNCPYGKEVVETLDEDEASEIDWDNYSNSTELKEMGFECLRLDGEQDDYVGYVMLVNGEPVGMYVSDIEDHLWTIEVLPAYRRKGYATKMVDEAFQGLDFSIYNPTDDGLAFMRSLGDVVVLGEREGDGSSFSMCCVAELTMTGAKRVLVNRACNNPSCALCGYVVKSTIQSINHLDEDLDEWFNGGPCPNCGLNVAVYDQVHFTQMAPPVDD